MKTIPTSRFASKQWLLGIFLGLLCSSSGFAIVINFEDYAVGNLSGNSATGTQWTTNSGTAAPIQVVSGVGVGGSQGIEVQTGAVTNSAYRFAPSDTDLGGAFSPTSSLLEVSFQLNWTEIVKGSTIGIGRFYLGVPVTLAGTAEVLSLDWYVHGMIGFTSNGVFSYAKNAGGTNFVATAGTYYTVHAIIDYSTKSYTLEIGGVQQTDNGNPVLSFRKPTGTNFNPNFDLQIVNGASANYRAWSMDNIQVAVVPEPGQAALFGLGFLVILASDAIRRAKKISRRELP